MDTTGGAKMREECPMPKRKRRKFTPEFRAEVVALCQVGDRTVAQVAKDLDLTESSVREWVRRSEADAGRGRPGELTTVERDELSRLRRENKQLRLEREILRAAATFFAKENA
ncbi:MAG: transposase [Sandaracinaceae bacterium]